MIFQRVTLSLVILIAVFYGMKRSVSASGVEINHVTLFTFGFLFYWILPLAIGVFPSDLVDQIPLGWGDMFKWSANVQICIIASGVIYLCYAAGDALGARLLQPVVGRQIQLSPLISGTVLILGSIFCVLTGFLNRQFLMGGYTFEGQSARGTVTAFVILLWTGLLFHVSAPTEDRSFVRRFLDPYAWPFYAGIAFLLLIGSRLYVASFICMFAVYRTSFVKRAKLVYLVAFVSVGAVLAGIIGSLRIGASAQDAWFNVVEEPLLTSLSLVHYLRYSQFAWFNWPIYLWSDFLNLVPTILWPNKFAELKSPDVYNPLGATNSFVSFNIYFGLIGTMAFMFVLGIAFQYLRSRTSGTLPRIIYVMLSGALAFTFFRDQFSISIVKVMFEDSILIPTMIVAADIMLPKRVSQ